MIYFMDKEEDLIGKEIAFTQMARFANAITIVTKDKGFLVVEQYKNDYESEIHIYNKRNAENHIFTDNYFTKQLISMGVLTEEDVENYNKEKQEQLKALSIQMEKEQEEADKRAYERLKQKYED